MMLVTGTVVGSPGSRGFFVRTERNRVVFVESPVPVAAGERVAGPLRAAEVAAFDGWERGMLGGLQPDWDLLRMYYVDAEAVTMLR